jgi:hypothetical protein
MQEKNGGGRTEPDLTAEDVEKTGQGNGDKGMGAGE